MINNDKNEYKKLGKALLKQSVVNAKIISRRFGVSMTPLLRQG